MPGKYIHKHSGKRSDHWRDSYNYRAEYFKRNPGLLGCIWLCSQCGKPLWGQDSVQVDHILPPSAFSQRKVNKRGETIKNTSFLARAMNSSFNTVAICPQCNQRKSDKIGICTAKGTMAKTGEVTAGVAQKVAAGTVYGAIHAVRFCGKAVMFPMKHSKSTLFKLVYLVCLAWLILYCFRGCSGCC